MKQTFIKHMIRYRWFRSMPLGIKITLDCLVYRDDSEGEWIARCLDLNLIASSSRKMDAVKELNGLIATQIQFTADNDNWAHLFRPAAKKEWDRFEQIQRKCEHKLTEIRTDHIQSTVDMCFA